MRTSEELVKEAQAEVIERQEESFKRAAKEIITGIAHRQVQIKRLEQQNVKAGEDLKNLKLEDFEGLNSQDAKCGPSNNF